MKLSQIFALVAVLSLSAHQAHALSANLFECEGDLQNVEGKVKLTYSSTSLTGKPTMSLKIANTQLLPIVREQSKTEILSESTAVGNLVTSVITFENIPDAPQKTYAVLIPNTVLTKMGDVVNFDTVLVSGSRGGYRRAPLAVQTVTSVQTLRCNASAVEF